jgi:hypothetical protein
MTLVSFQEKGGFAMYLKRQSTFNLLLTAFIFTGCASFEPGLRHQDLTRTRQPTVKRVQNGLEVSVEEFASASKSLKAFDADLSSYGVLALLVRVENNGTENYNVQRADIKGYLGDQPLSQLVGTEAAGEAGTREYAGKALGWTLATGPFAIILWPATIAGSASHTASVNRRVEQHFESLAFTNALLKPNQVAVGFVYFKLPDGVKRLENLTVEVEPSEEKNGRRLSYKLSLPGLDLSAPASNPETSEDVERNR